MCVLLLERIGCFTLVVFIQSCGCQYSVSSSRCLVGCECGISRAVSRVVVDDDVLHKPTNHFKSSLSKVYIAGRWFESHRRNFHVSLSLTLLTSSKNNCLATFNCRYDVKILTISMQSFNESLDFCNRS